jgi:hypothetical protein
MNTGNEASTTVHALSDGLAAAPPSRFYRESLLSAHPFK